MDKVDMAGLCRRYENGQVMWRVCGDATCSFLPAGKGFFTPNECDSGSELITPFHLEVFLLHDNIILVTKL